MRRTARLTLPTGEIKVTVIEFQSGSAVVRGWLRIPNGAGPHPLVILAHGLGGLKEWDIPAVADALVGSGIAALAFDYRNFGDSDGTPREEVDHCGQIEDFRSALTFASMRSEIDAERIGLWGTSLGGRNVLVVAALDQRVKCVFAQVPAIMNMRRWLHYGASLFSGGDVTRFHLDLAEDRRERAMGKEPRYVALELDPNQEYYERLLAFGEEELRNYKSRLTIRSFEPTVVHEIVHLMRLITPKPLRMVLTEQDVLYADQIEAFTAALEPKSLTVLPGHHYALYAQGKHRETTGLDKAVDTARAWFVEHLA
jgi:pimeloyl-ACP methyl ester carboxylesterase